MTYSFKFSIIIAFNNAQDYIDKSISAIIKQSMDFTENIQLILVDMNSTDNSSEKAQEYYKQYPVNITILKQEENDLSSAYKEALLYCEGQYTSFIRVYDYISLNCLKEAYELLDNNKKDIDLLSVPINYIGQTENDPLNNKYETTRIINLNIEPNNPQISLYSTFIKTDSLKKHYTNINESDIFINKILMSKKSYGLLSHAIYYRDNTQTDSEDCMSKISLIDDKLIPYSINLEGCIPKFIQYTKLYYLINMIENSSNEDVSLPETIIKEMENIDYEIILDNNKINQNTKNYLLYLKNDCQKEIKNINSTIIVESNNEILEDFTTNPIIITGLSVKEDILSITAEYESLLDNVQIRMMQDNCEYSPEKQDIIIEEYFNKKWTNHYKLTFNIPLNQLENHITFQIQLENIIYAPLIKQDKIQLPKIYNLKDEKIIFFTDNKNIKSMKYDEDIREYYKFSIITAVYNTQNYISETIDSVINQSIDFKQNVQLILVNDGSTDNSLEILQEYQKQYPENIILITTEHKGQAHARNIGLQYAKGEYINFLDSDDYLSINTLLEVYNYFEEVKDDVDIISIPIKYTEAENSDHKLHYKYSKTRILDLIEHPNYPQLSVSSAFFKSTSITNMQFNTQLKYSEDALFVNQVLLDKKQYAVMDKPIYFQRRRLTEDALDDIKELDKEYYNIRLLNFHKNIIECSKENKHSNQIPKFIQYLLAYDIQELLQVYDIEEVLTQNEMDEFDRLLLDVISHIDESVILNNRNIDSAIENYFIYLNNFRQINYDENNKSEIELKTANTLIDTFERHKLGLDIIDINNGHLYLSGYLTSYFDEEESTIKIIKINKTTKKEEIISCEYVSYPQIDRRTEKHLSESWKYYHCFDVKIPLDNQDYLFKFVMNIENDQISKEFYPELAFRLPSGLSTTGIYMIEDNKILYFQQNALHITKYKYTKMLRLEASINKKIYNDKKDGYKQAIKLRLLHLALYPFMKNKQVWLFNDRPLLADDNAKHLFKYATKQKDGIRKYYVLKKESDDWNAMKEIDKNIVEFGSFKHKLLYLLSDKHISAFVNEEYRNPFYTPGGFDHRRLYSGLALNHRYFLQHGVTLGNVTRSLKKYNTNLSLIVCGSEKEQNSFFQWDYNYDKEIIQVLGLPRYDNLSTDDTKKQIVFMPTWRAPLSHSQKAFLSSDFYNSLISFINNEKMLEEIEKLGYKFVFKPHPELMKYLHLMPINDKIVISENDSYQELFRDSSILITDYSSVAFDFAYLKKPVIYYQPNDDYPYEKGYFEFDTMGFGDVITEEEQTVEKILKYLRTGCQMEDKYKERVNEFFKYTDRNNCMRVYEWIKND